MKKLVFCFLFLAGIFYSQDANAALRYNTIDKDCCENGSWDCLPVIIITGEQ